MSVNLFNSENTTMFIHNETLYSFNNEFISNSEKFNILQNIIFEYNYVEFYRDFNEIYNSANDKKRQMCFVVLTFCDEYDKYETDAPYLDTGDIIAILRNEMLESVGRKNSRVFNLSFIDMIICWRCFKGRFNNWITIDSSYEITHQIKNINNSFTLSQKIERFLLHFDY